jgi:hypothetical protein
VRQFGSDKGRTGLVPNIKNLSILTRSGPRASTPPAGRLQNLRRTR